MKVPYYSPWITKTDKSYLMKALNQRWLTNGPFLKKFEKKIEKKNEKFWKIIRAIL